MMATFTVTINTDNAAFEGERLGHEIALILHRLAVEVESDMAPKTYFMTTVQATNGSNVGKCEFKKG